MPKIIDRVLRAGEGRVLRHLEGIVAQVNAIEEDFLSLSDAELRAETDRFKARIADGESLDSLLPEAFAAVREASSRTIGKRHFDVQVMGGAALHMGNVAEMKTGEGKTLVATLPSYLNALSGKGVHVVTVNDFLAKYQSELMGRVHRMLGLETGVILSHLTPAQRRAEYAKDITYGTNNEFGFDYLRDNMAWQTEELVQRGHNFAIVDEVDSILIDEARTPLIISGPADGVTRWYVEMAKMVKHLERGRGADRLRGIEAEGDYEVDEKKKTVGILEPGIAKVEDYLGIDNLYESNNTPLIGYLNNAIKAKELFKRDKDYVVMDGEVLIVDEHTGRILAGRRYNEGMHQAIEAKEGVKIQNENQTLATVTLQNYFRLYNKLSGMTGTAQTEAAELHQIYKVGVVQIRTNRPMVRRDQPDLVYRTEVAKFDAVVKDIVERHRKGQPVLVGTTSVEKSEYLSQQLDAHDVPHEVLNAKYHEREAAIVAEAGRRGAVTVATNMAGRGTDIMLGGNPEFRAVDALRRRGLSPEETPEEYEAAWDQALAEAEAAVKSEHDEVSLLGGLYVLGTERHESRRIDNQLRGRSGRQGDPGESRFYLSLQDDLMRLFNAERVNRFMVAVKMDDSVPISAKMVTRSIQSAQTQVEGRNFDIRKNVLKYDDVLNTQRKVIYGERRRVLEGEDLHEQMRYFINDVVTEYVRAATEEQLPEDWKLEQLWSDVAELFPVSLSLADVESAAGGRSSVTREILVQELISDAQFALDAREAQFGRRAMREVERRVVLSVLDRKWREHLYEMDYLKEGIGLRAMAQRDPVVEYSREGHHMFQAMIEAIKEDAVRLLFNADIKVDESQLPPEEAPEQSSGEAVRGEGVEHPDARRFAYSGGGDTVGETEQRGNRRERRSRRLRRRGR
ncbi:preprotein translocase subunit SecA [Dermatophilus congolensis]|uniref:Protein translocase subunit SecA n=1 Tax=Dermatophilus congolensis TaxID=1863 RepID=A0A239VHY3_9MICO|nr:preprotein translocase subunit SecA [Dermatophilus congolensis]MBO3129066.1 preprotein translocase subunit SecA [Dermatophilus congolensis]MBO3132298.1 preprotein translocase subunit SecA [Dermatophilus congolensis]MBO3133542.1 preprotein translocase subunit SecA [Dermatophilus congolensis]MBO3135775.1 preprotein translocase subunit SecA [Dermatophilus congolensis]MBO3138014.1 preprotein translocase subunit SecA [Dermatophilus congolensis]